MRLDRVVKIRHCVSDKKRTVSASKCTKNVYDFLVHSESETAHLYYVTCTHFYFLLGGESSHQFPDMRCSWIYGRESGKRKRTKNRKVAKEGEKGKAMAPPKWFRCETRGRWPAASERTWCATVQRLALALAVIWCARVCVVWWWWSRRTTELSFYGRLGPVILTRWSVVSPPATSTSTLTTRSVLAHIYTSLTNVLLSCPSIPGPIANLHVFCYTLMMMKDELTLACCSWSLKSSDFVLV